MEEAFHQPQHVKEPGAATLDGDLQLEVRNPKNELHLTPSQQHRKKGELAGVTSPARVGFESHPPHHHVEIVGGFVRVISSMVFGLPEDLSTIVVFSGDEFEAYIH